MIRNPYVAGVVAGGVAALLYLSLATGSTIGLLLFYLAPLPGFIVGFGWGVPAATIAAISGTLLILFGLGKMPAIAYAVSLAIPSVIITRFVFLYRPAPSQTGQPDQDDAAFNPEWYPVGRLVLLVTLLGGVLATLAVLALGTSYDSYLDKIGSEINLLMSKADEAGFFRKMSPEKLEQYKHLVQTVLPAATAVLWSLFALVNMWIAAHIVRLSDMLPRPWPDLSRIEFPQITSFILLVLLVLAVILPGLAGLLLSAFAGALMLAFLLLGLAVVHSVSRPWPVRGLFLFATYVAVLFIGWGSLVMVLLGVVEPFVHLRNRVKDPPAREQ